MQRMQTSTTGEFGRRGPNSTIDLLDLFWRRKSYLIVCMLLSIVLGALYCSLSMTVYESTADVLVVQKRPHAVTGDQQYESAFGDYLATHLAIIASPKIVKRAVEGSELGSLASFADLEDPEDLVDTIIGSLEVEGGSRELGESADSIMTLAFRGSVPEDCPKVVQALLDSYEDFHDEVYGGMSDNTVSLIRKARDLLTNDLVRQEEAYSEFRQQSPLVARGTDEVNPLQDRLTSIDVQRSELLLRKAEVEWQLAALEQAKQEGSDAQQLLAIVTELRQQQATTENGLPTVSSTLENQLIQLIDGERSLMEHYGPNHPHVLTMRQRMAETRRLFALPTTAHLPVPNSDEASETSSANADPVAVYTQYLQQELKRLEISEGLLTVLYDREHEAAKQHSIFQLKDERLRRGIQRTESLYDVVIARLQEASLIKDFGGYKTEIIAPPMLGEKVGPSRRIILPVAAFAGILLGCMLALVVELRDDSFQSCDQIQQQLGLPVVGQIPQFAAARKSRRSAVASDVALDPMLCSYHGPRSLPAESFRKLRTALFFNSLGESSRVIQVTGASAEDGASTVASNLAISLAQTGKRVLLIDADLSKQRQSQMFGIDPTETGLAAIVASDVEPADAICQTAVDNLCLLPAGPLPEGPCELFTSPRFGELVNLVRDSYDHVLIDTEPLLVASDPAVIASHTDGVVLALGLARDSRQRAMRAKLILDRLDVSILGIVVNRLNNAILKRHQMGRNDYARSGDVRRGSRTRQAVVQ